MSVAYGESLSNLLQPFFLLIVFPVMGKGIKIQARDVIGYLFIPFIFVYSDKRHLYHPNVHCVDFCVFYDYNPIYT